MLKFLKPMTIGTMVLMSGVFAWGHGEDKPGPNGGYIQMPGAFHTELVPVSDKMLKIYLLDMEWKNPTITDSAVELRHSLGKRSLNAACKADKDHFVCEFPTAVDMKKGMLEIKPQRMKAKGNLASYKLPLTFPKPAANDEHSGHH
jgi:hypothetical protein